MRKSILSPATSSPPTPSLPTLPPDRWLNLEELARVELSSEHPSHPFEDALPSADGSQGSQRNGWKAAASGPQTIRLTFDNPQPIRRIRLVFREDGPERSQEFALYVATANHGRKELVRQQWTFSPGGSTQEVEDYRVELADVIAIELQIDPGRHDKHQIASLQSIALA